MKITFDSGLVRYCNDRFLDVELVTNTVTGLKLPLSAVVTKEFYTIPSEMAVEGGANGSTGFLKEVTGEDGKVTSSFVEASIYAEIPEENGMEVSIMWKWVLWRREMYWFSRIPMPGIP